MPTGDTAYLYEATEPNVGGRWSGTFSAQFKPAHGDWVHGPEGLDIEAGLAWARERAPLVLIRLGGDNEFYTAGRDDVPDVPRRWPEGMPILPRPFGEPPDAPRQRVPWLVHVAIPARGDAGRRLAGEVRDVLEASGRLTRVRVEEPEPGTFRLECTIEAGNSDDAVLDTDALLPETYDDALPEPGRFRINWFTVVHLVGRVVDCP